MAFLKIEPEARACDVQVTDEELIVRLTDGRAITAPLAWFPKLEKATLYQRAHWQILGQGEGIHWPDVDEDLSVAGLLRGEPAG